MLVSTIHMPTLLQHDMQQTLLQYIYITCKAWGASAHGLTYQMHHPVATDLQRESRFSRQCLSFGASSSSGLPPDKAPVMIAEKHKLFFSFLFSSVLPVEPILSQRV